MSSDELASVERRAPHRLAKWASTSSVDVRAPDRSRRGATGCPGGGRGGALERRWPRASSRPPPSPASGAPPAPTASWRRHLLLLERVDCGADVDHRVLKHLHLLDAPATNSSFSNNASSLLPLPAHRLRRPAPAPSWWRAGGEEHERAGRRTPGAPCRLRRRGRSSLPTRGRCAAGDFDAGGGSGITRYFELAASIGAREGLDVAEPSAGRCSHECHSSAPSRRPDDLRA